MLSSKQKVILIVLVGIIGIVVGYLFLAEKEDAIQVDYPDNLSQDSVNNTDHSEDYQSFILKQMSGSGINETKNAFEISLPSEYNAILNVDGVLITVKQDDFKLLIGTQLDSTGGTYTTLPEYELLEWGIIPDDIWRIKTIEGYYYTSFFELKTGADTCKAYSQSDAYVACGTDRIDFDSNGKTKSLFISCTEIEDGRVEGCDQLVTKDLKIKLL